MKKKYKFELDHSWEWNGYKGQTAFMRARGQIWSVP